MKVNTIAVSYERKFNLGDYNSLKLEATMWADLEEGDVAQDVIRSLQDTVRTAVKSEYIRMKSSVGPNQNVSAKSQLAPVGTSEDGPATS